MNLSPGDNDQVDCLYTWNGKDRALRLDANHVKHCWAELQYKDIKTMKITKITFYCD